jgi:hypothetical protein
MGGGSAALMGGDPLKGALMGGLTGGAGAGISGALGTAVAPAVAPGVIAPAIAPEIAATALAPEIAVASQVAPQTLLSPTTLPGVSNGIAGIPTSFDSFGSQVPITSPAYSMADPTGLAQQQLNLNSAAAQAAKPGSGQGTFMEGMKRFTDSPLASIKGSPFTAAGSALAGANAGKKKLEEEEKYSGPLSRFRFNPDSYQPSFFAAEGGIATLAAGGYDRMVGEEPMYMSNMASGGISNLGSYSDGGRMLKGPGDGMSDSIPASISGKRPARLADGEFVVPADVVSHLGNGSTDAGAKQLYAMMNKVRQARTGRKSQGREIDPRKYTPAYA